MLQVILIFQRLPFFLSKLFWYFHVSLWLMLSEPFPLDRLKALRYIEARFLSSPGTAWRRSSVQEILLGPWNRRRAGWGKSKTLRHRRWRCKLLKCGLFITSNLTFPPKMFPPEASLTTSLQTITYIGLSPEIQHQFHKFTFLDLPFQSMAWDLLQLFQEAQSYPAC